MDEQWQNSAVHDGTRFGQVYSTIAVTTFSVHYAFSCRVSRLPPLCVGDTGPNRISYIGAWICRTGFVPVLVVRASRILVRFTYTFTTTRNRSS